MGSIPVTDLQSVLKKYDEERDKRLRPEGWGQYLDIGTSEKFKHFAKDPWATPDNEYVSQALPIEDGSHVKVLVVGSGFGALVFAIRLILEAGFKAEDFVFVDTAFGFGGTWYWNRYPGLMCDVESSCYLPFLEETGYIPKHRYSYAPELRAYVNLLVEKWQLKPRAVSGSTIENATWNDDLGQWDYIIKRQLPGPDEPQQTLNVSSEFMILTAGILNRPKLPRLTGTDQYKGHIFHTSRFDYDATGGSPDSAELTKLKGKKVALIGTGATAIQLVPELAKWVDKLYVFQRTPSSVSERGQRSLNPEDFQREVATGKGWQNDRRMNMATFVSNPDGLPEKDLVDDGWTNMTAFAATMGSPLSKGLKPEDLMAFIGRWHQMDLPRANAVRERVRNIVKDQETAENLCSWYAAWCKRPGFHDDYLQTFNSSSVELVDTEGKGIDGFDKNGVVYNGTTYDADMVILGTGYSAPNAGTPATRANMQIVGRGGLAMSEKWDQGIRTLHGCITRDFPNLFFPGFNQGPATVNFLHTADIAAQHTAKIINMAQKANNVTEGKKLVLQPTAEAELAWAQRSAQYAIGYAAVGGCTPSYNNAEGARFAASTPEDQIKAAMSAPWGLGLPDFCKVIEEWERAGDLSELDIQVR